MNDDSKIIDAATRFRETVEEAEKKQEQHRSDGAKILHGMKKRNAKNLNPKDQ